MRSAVRKVLVAKEGSIIRLSIRTFHRSAWSLDKSSDKVDSNREWKSKVGAYWRLARADKPIGSMLLLWPCIWSTALTSMDPLLMTKFAIGSFIMRGAGCTINDLWDKEFDKQVERTKDRPLASGELSVADALKFLTLQLGGGLVILVSLPIKAIKIGLMSMPLVVAYPLMKRYTNWPQFVLGMTFNWGVWVGWAASEPQTLTALTMAPLYVAGICWTLVYDTLYGYQDRKDDLKIGVKSTAIHLGDKPQAALTLFSSGFLGGLLATGYLADLSAMYFVGSSVAWSHLLWQIWTADINDPANLSSRFKSNTYTGAIVAASIVAGSM